MLYTNIDSLNNFNYDNELLCAKIVTLTSIIKKGHYMLFNSLEFLIFLPFVTAIYFLFPNKVKYLWLLFASYFFYMCWNVKYLLLLFISTMVTFISGLLLNLVKSQKYSITKEIALKRIVVLLSLCLNLGILFYFKYYNFSNIIFAKIATLIHVEFNYPRHDIILPVGISFYTFQALSYTIDIYRNEIEAEKNFFRFALFVSFFPQLVAGPIERSRNLIYQISNPQKFDWNDFREGFLLMLWGFFLKLVLADRIAIFVDFVYSDYTSYPGYFLILATILFSIQIYCDFYGYSTIAKGTAKILRINLSENFNSPYLSMSFSQFWKNWHITLSSWFRDYLYIPMGGNRKGKFRKYINIFIVFMASGLWHGAQLSFVLWGAVNGLYQILEELMMPLWIRITDAFRINRNSIGYLISNYIRTYLLICFSWIFFRANSIHTALEIIESIFSIHNPWIMFDGSIYSCGIERADFGLLIISMLVLLFADICKKKNIEIRKIILSQDYLIRCILMALAVCSILLFGKWGPAYDKTNFIYFQF